MGTRFIATRESNAQDAYKQMLVDAGGDMVYTDAISGTNANFLWPSLESSATAAKNWCRASARAS
jgi:nitronate monooxygenase